MNRTPLACIRDMVREVVRDARYAVEVVVTTPTQPAVDPASGVVTIGGLGETVQGYLSDEAWVRPGGERGDAHIYVMAADLSVRPTTSTRCRVDGVLYAVVGVEHDPLGIFHELLVRRTA